MKEGEVDRERHADAPDREARSARSRRTTSTSARTCCSSTTSRTTSARSSTASAPRSWRPRTSRRRDPGASWPTRGCSLVDQYMPQAEPPRRTGTSPVSVRRSSATSRPGSIRQGWLAQEPRARGAGAARAAAERGVRGLRRQGGAGGRGEHAPPREAGDAAATRHALARAPRRDGLPAPGDSPARLRAEGLPLRVQARGVRAVRRHARAHQVRDRDAHGDGGDPHPAGHRARGGGAPAAPDAGAAGPARGGRLAAGGPGDAAAARAARRGPPGLRRAPSRTRSAAARRATRRAPSCAPSARWDATSPVRAARAGSTSTATACSRAATRPDGHTGIARPCSWSSPLRSTMRSGGS